MTDDRSHAPEPPPYPDGRGYWTTRRCWITVAAGTGIGFATVKRCVEEGVCRHHRHPRAATPGVGRRSSARALGIVANVTAETDVQSARRHRVIDEFGSSTCS